MKRKIIGDKEEEGEDEGEKEARKKRRWGRT